ncbi:MAG: LapA family protein [Actinomycetota bacterium]
MTEQKKETNWRAWMIGVLALLVLIVALQNSQEVPIDVLFVTTKMPLIVALLVSVAIGALIGYVAPVLRRHRREERRAEKG